MTMSCDGEESERLPSRPPPPCPPPRSELFPFFSEEAVSVLLRKCKARGAKSPSIVGAPFRWRLIGEGEPVSQSDEEAPLSSDSSEACDDEEDEFMPIDTSRLRRSIFCFSGICLGSQIARGGLGQVLAAATVESRPRPLVAKKYWIHPLRRNRTAVFLAGGDVRVVRELERFAKFRLAEAPQGRSERRAAGCPSSSEQNCRCAVSRVYTEEAARKLFRQMLLAVGSLHSLRVVHKDLKPTNIVLFKEPLEEETCWLHLPAPEKNSTAPDSMEADDDDEGDSEATSVADDEDAFAEEFLFYESPEVSAPRKAVEELRRSLAFVDSDVVRLASEQEGPVRFPTKPRRGAMESQLEKQEATALNAARSLCARHETVLPLWEALETGLDTLLHPEDSEASDSEEPSDEETSNYQGEREEPELRQASSGLDQEEEPLIQLVDFNSATVTDDDACTIWDAAGSSHFIPPECLGFSEEDGWSGKARDIYALGVTLYCMLFARPPFWWQQGLALAGTLKASDIEVPDSRTLSTECRDILKSVGSGRDSLQEKFTLPPKTVAFVPFVQTPFGKRSVEANFLRRSPDASVAQPASLTSGVDSQLQISDRRFPPNGSDIELVFCCIHSVQKELSAT